MRLTPPKRGEALRGLFERFHDADFLLYYVGGTTRDIILGRTVDDIDLATNATPREVHEILESCPGVTLHATGVEHGTWTVVVNGAEAVEITSFRKDVETDGRRAVVSFSRNIEDDAYRRDLTINALYMDNEGNLIDPTGQGLADIQKRLLRFVGDADSRCREDYLRILRLFRFQASLNGTLDPAALRAAAQNRLGLRRIARERVTVELKKLLAADAPCRALRDMDQTRVLCEVVARSPVNLRALHVLTRAEADNGLEAYWPRRYACTFLPECDSLFRFSNRERFTIGAIRDMAARGEPAAVTAYRTRSADITTDALLVRAAREGKTAKIDHSEISRGIDAEIPVTARDLMEIGIHPGALLGSTLQHAAEVFAQSNLKANRVEILCKVTEKSVDKFP